MGNQLVRTVGLWPTVATAVGIVVASTSMVSLGQGFGIAGPGFIIAMVCAMLLNLFVAFSFSELSSIIPRAGGINHYTLPTMGPFVGMISVISGYLLVNMFAGSAEASIAGFVVSDVFLPSVPPALISVIFVVILGLINIRGIKLYSWVQLVLTILLIGSLVIIGLIGLTGTGTGEPLETTLDFNTMGWGIFGLTALAFWLFVGIEFVCPMAEEIKKPRLYIPLSMILALLIILITDIIYGFASIRYVPLDQLANSESPHVLAATAILSRTGQIWIGIITVLATVSTINTLIMAISRMLYSMAHEGQLPKIFGELNRWGSPWFSTVFMTAIFCIFIIAGIATAESITALILAGAFCWFVTYIIAHLNVIILRYKYPNVKRTFKSPLGITFQVIGILGMLYMMVNIFPEPDVKSQIYRFALLFLALTVLYAFLWVKFVMKKSLFEITPLEKLLEEVNLPDDEAQDLPDEGSTVKA